ncbi:chemotaxis-specific protein-glutamate methyltransferase CheB [Halegenticoccus tardaugens]|uniref:chemotaxis-specific protein-glutamate methyltransferase CheB n=1 Tax=Halegenticoccus tardaugens TaxID=2071624 RepID=UPI003744228C
MRGLISDVLRDGGVEVVAEAGDGDEAVRAVEDRRPDVVTMDVEMPGTDGIEAVERIMATRPTPILMLSAHTEAGADVTFEALDKGAVDFFAKPGGEVSTGVAQLKDELVEKVVTVSAASVDRTTATPTAVASAEPTDATLVVGSSTGGPNAIERVLAALPREASLRILVVQHMPEAFTARFASRLDERCAYDVREAGDGDRIGGGEALVAHGGSHMEVSHAADGRLRVRLVAETLGLTVQPAVDVTMRSAAEAIDGPLVGVVLTGMGSDGAAGAEAIHRAGGRVVAQDEASSVVYGMPKRAVETGCVDEVCRLDEVAARALAAARALSRDEGRGRTASPNRGGE